MFPNYLFDKFYALQLSYFIYQKIVLFNLFTLWHFNYLNPLCFYRYDTLFKFSTNAP